MPRQRNTPVTNQKGYGFPLAVLIVGMTGMMYAAALGWQMDRDREASRQQAAAKPKVVAQIPQPVVLWKKSDAKPLSKSARAVEMANNAAYLAVFDAGRR